jgi:hypothetical protein
VPSEIVFPNGGSVSVCADFQEVADALARGDVTLETARFAGFRDGEPVAGERVLVRLAKIAYVRGISGP